MEQAAGCLMIKDTEINDFGGFEADIVREVLRAAKRNAYVYPSLFSLCNGRGGKMSQTVTAFPPEYISSVEGALTIDEILLPAVFNAHKQMGLAPICTALVITTGFINISLSDSDSVREKISRNETPTIEELERAAEGKEISEVVMIALQSAEKERTLFYNVVKTGNSVVLSGGNIVPEIDLVEKTGVTAKIIFGDLFVGIFNRFLQIYSEPNTPPMHN